MKTKLLSIRTTLAGALALLNLSAEVFAQHPLDSWVRRTVPGPSPALNSIECGNGTFVAVGDNSFVAHSTDGITWTTSTAGAYGTLTRVRFLNGQFVAVGSSDKLIYSSDGASWTASTLPQAGFWDIAWGNGVYVLAGQRTTSAQGTYVSPDGINWTRTHPMVQEPPPFNTTYETALDTVVFGNGRFQALPGGAALTHQTRQSLSSTNGIDWITSGSGLASLSGGGGGGELLYQDGAWLSAMDGNLLLNNRGIWASTNNGALWDLRVENRFARDGSGSALSYGQGYFVTLMDYDGVRVVTSTNGFLSWQERFPVTNRFAVVRGSAFGSGTFVAVGYDEQATTFILQSGNIGGVPIIFHEPQDRSAVVDNPATFSVQVVGAPPLMYQWYHGTNAISGATNNSYAIAHVATGDIGGYHVVITNSFGSVTSRVAQLTVAFLGIDLYAGIKILGVPGRTYQIEATPATGTPNWQTLTNLALPSTPYIWIDYDSPAVPARLYRAAELP